MSDQREATCEDLDRRVLHRVMAAQRAPSKLAVRRQVECSRCRKDIPETRRADARYCSVRCQRNYRWEQITALRTEMRAEFRRLTAPERCECGEELHNPAGKRGRIKKKCRRCGNRDSQREHRKRKAETIESNKQDGGQGSA